MVKNNKKNWIIFFILTLIIIVSSILFFVYLAKKVNKIKNTENSLKHTKNTNDTLQQEKTQLEKDKTDLTTQRDTAERAAKRAWDRTTEATQEKETVDAKVQKLEQDKTDLKDKQNILIEAGIKTAEERNLVEEMKIEETLKLNDYEKILPRKILTKIRHKISNEFENAKIPEEYKITQEDKEDYPIILQILKSLEKPKKNQREADSDD